MALPDSLYWDDKNEDESIGFTVGFTAFDSRFLKVEPFIGFGSYDFMNLYDDANTSVFVLGLNTDVRIFATKPQHYGGFSVALVARLKYQALFGTLEAFGPDFGGEEIEAGFVAHQFGINLGLFLW